MTFTLVGFIADLTGSEGHIFEAAPVVRWDERMFAARGLDWTPEDLVELDSLSTTSVHPIPLPTPIRPGETVWVGGRSFVDGVKHCGFLEDDAFEIGGWIAGVRGFKASSGTRTAFSELVQRLRYKLEHGIHAALFDPLELFSGDAPGIYALYASLPVTPDLQYQLTKALYFDHKRDEYSVDFVRTESVHVYQVVDSAEAFDLELLRLETRLRRPRLGEQVHGSLPALPTPATPPTYIKTFYASLQHGRLMGNSEFRNRWIHEYGEVAARESEPIS